MTKSKRPGALTDPTHLGIRELENSSQRLSKPTAGESKRHRLGHRRVVCLEAVIGAGAVAGGLQKTALHVRRKQVLEKPLYLAEPAILEEDFK